MSGKKRATRRPRSVVWYYFDKVPNDHFKAKCKICGSLCQHGTNTSNLFYHLRHRHPASYAEAEEQKDQELKLYNELKVKAGRTVTQPTRGRGRGRGPGRPPKIGVVHTNGEDALAVVKSENHDLSSSFTPQTLSLSSSNNSTGRKSYGSGAGKGKFHVDVNKALIDWMATDMLHPSAFTTKGFKVFLNNCGIQADLPTKKSLLESHIPKLVEETRVRVKQELEAASSVALSVENWMFRGTQAFITLTAHFVTDNWSMKSYVLESFDCTEDRTETNLSSNLRRITDEWGLTQNVEVIMSDASNETMSGAVVVNGWEELLCFGRALNLVVDSAMASVPEITRVQKKMSEAVSYFYRTTKALEALSAVQQQHSLPADRLKQERANMWTSTYAAMERVVEQYEAVNTVLCFLGRDHMCLCDDEVELIRDVIQVLKPFKAAVEELCTQAYTCVSKLIPIASLLQQVTAASINVQEAGSAQAALKASLLSQMQHHMADLESKPVLATATLLDPRFKHHAFTDTDALAAAQERLLLLTQEAVKNIGNTNVNTDTDELPETTATLWSMFDRKVVDAKALKTDVSEADNETRRFFKEVNIVRTANPLRWWELNEIQFPHLKVLAKKFMCVPATAIHSKRLFYKEGSRFATNRDMFRPLYLNNMLFLQQNLH